MDPDIYGTALLEHLQGQSGRYLTTYLQLPGFREPLRDQFSLDYLFRSHEQMPVLERKALQLCEGHTLDIGAGAGSHSLYLQSRGLTVTALDRSAGAARVCRQRGIRQVIQADIRTFRGGPYDTLLLLMNGIGLAGSLSGLAAFLYRLKQLLHPEGQILVDSSDIRYMYEDGKGNMRIRRPAEPYYGQGKFVMEYRGKRTVAFPWLYLDFDSLHSRAQASGLECDRVAEGAHYDFLARLTVK